jgi:class 3 adenylate cyclase
VQRFLGEGGRKRVYLAHDNRLDRDVAIAVIKTEGLDEAGLSRVHREAQAMGRLGDHPHVVTVFDIGDEARQPYIVSQYMAGGDLDALLGQAEDRRLSLDQAVRIANEVRQALEHAHSRGIIHRDLKPGNIWLDEGGSAKLGDFGLAVAVDRSRLTMEGMMVGTVAYMPPEQALGRQPDARSDLYSLGCVMYEMVTGRPPFLGDDAVAIISQHINTAPVAPSWHNPDVPKALEALILRLLAKDPAERPESAAAIPDALEAIMETASTVAERVSEEVANPLDRLAGGVFVGREKEMDELRAGLEDSLSGRGRLLMLVGEPGIGKTRTSEELATYASLRNVQVLWGRCYEGEGAPAYWPWVQLVRSYIHDRDPQDLMTEMGPGAADIAEVVSEVRERLPGLPTPPTLEPEQARFRLFDSITTFLKNGAKRQPLVLVLDDLHWADKPSLLLLQFLARELRGGRLMVLGTYRDVELRRQHPLSQTLGELAREGLSQRIVLRGLTKRDVARFLEITSGVKPPEGLVTAVYQETEGNPFFVNEVVRLLVADGRLERPEEVKSWSVTIPQGVREVVGRRLDHLSDECNRVLTIASVIGREFGLDALERVSDVSGDRLLDALEEAVGARVIVEVPRSPGRYSFSHALMRETLYEELSTTRRVRQHRQIGEALEALYGESVEPHLAELAYHFSEGAQGGDVDKAIDYAVRAGERATELLAYEEATNHYELALQALELKEQPAATQHCELLLALGEAQIKAGEPQKAMETCDRAAGIARDMGSPETLARAALDFGRASGATGAIAERSQPAVDLIEEALSVLPEGDSALRAMLLGRLANILWLARTSQDRVLSRARESVEMARRVKDSEALVIALQGMRFALTGSEEVDERVAVSTEILQMAEQAGDKTAAYYGLEWRCLDLLEAGDVSSLDVEVETLDDMADELRQPALRWFPQALKATLLLFRGRLEDADEQGQQALVTARRFSRGFLLPSGVQLFALRREQGRLAELEGAQKAFADRFPAVPSYRCGLAYVHSEQRREEEAREQFERLAASGFAEVPRDDAWQIGMIFLSEVCAFLGDAARAAALYDLLLPYARLNVGHVGNARFGSGSRFLGLLAATMERWEDAEKRFEDALEMNTRMGAKPWIAWTQHQYADMLVRRDGRGDRDRALELLSQALNTAQQLRLKTLTVRALALKLQAQGIDLSEVQTSIDAVAASVYVDKPDLRSHASPDGTVTILFSDIEGSTEMTERLGDQRWLEVLHEHNAIIRERVAACGGFEVKSEGDGFMLAFQSARTAVRCAVDIQQALAERNDGADEPIKVRIGLHTGEAIKEGDAQTGRDDFFGKHVILAARIASQAQGGEVLVSSLLKDLTDSGGEVEFGEGREVVHLDAYAESSHAHWAERRRMIRHAFTRVVDAVVKEDVDLFLVVGDFFDSNRASDQAIEFAIEQLRRSTAPVVILPGNHDPYSANSVYRRVDFERECGNVRVVTSTKGARLTFADLDLALWGRADDGELPYAALEGLPPRGGERWFVGMAHADVLLPGRKPWASIHIRPEEIAAAETDYLALGHWEPFEDVSQNGVKAVYSGAPMPLTDGTNGAGYAAIAELGDEGVRSWRVAVSDRTQR